MRIYTVGQARISPDTLVETLKAHRITHVIDVRCESESMASEAFAPTKLSSFLLLNGIRYANMGGVFGFPDDTPDEDIHEIASSEEHLSSLQMLLQIAADDDRVVCLMGTSATPDDCSRGRLVAESLTENGVDVQHIQEGFLIPHRAIRERIRAR